MTTTVLGWLTQCDLKIETESLVFAAQDQALNTNYYNFHVLGGPNSSCRLSQTMKLLLILCLAALLWQTHHIRSVTMR